MKIDSSQIDKRALRQLLQEQYGLEAARLTFVPQGEESYGYILETLAQSSYFIKVYAHLTDLDVRYEAASRLHTHCRLEFVVHPHATKSGKFSTKLGEYALAVFDFVDGTISDQSGYSDEEWKQLAVLTASLHESAQCQALPPLPVQQFEISFEAWLRRVLEATEDTTPLHTECERGARELLISERDDILMTLEKLRDLAQHAQTITIMSAPALTHGDLKLENFIKDQGGGLHLIDWSKLALAPPERDLVNFVGERFEMFLEAYVSGCGKTPQLHAELFEFYSYFLNLWSVADYGSWILLEDADVADKEHAWTELQQHLPINHKRVQVDEVGQIIKRVLNRNSF